MFPVTHEKCPVVRHVKAASTVCVAADAEKSNRSLNQLICHVTDYVLLH
jgi:hypothetical protein